MPFDPPRQVGIQKIDADQFQLKSWSQSYILHKSSESGHRQDPGWASFHTQLIFISWELVEAINKYLPGKNRDNAGTRSTAAR